MVIAIDGPAGAGKSTIARLIAKRLNCLYIDTGAMYRALTLKALRAGSDFEDEDQLSRLAMESRIGLENNNDGSVKVLLDQEDVSVLIRMPQITKHVSFVARVAGVRKEMLRLQRAMGSTASCVLDGRDIGTVVFPSADKKYFLDADQKTRAIRRYKELKGSGIEMQLSEVEEDIQNRDKIDSSRECAPLKKAQDALYVDTTVMGIEEVAEYILKDIKARWRTGNG